MVDIIGIGVQKAASTWIFANLVRHPEVRGAVTENGKELNFFSCYYEKGYDWYDSHFCEGDHLNVEYSPVYFHNRSCPRRVHRYNPDAKLLLTLRDPVDRAISQHLHEIRKSRVDEGSKVDLRGAVRRNPSYVTQGLYAENLRFWLEVFPRSQIHVVLMDEIVREAEVVLEELYRFIGVDEEHVPPNYDNRQNVARLNSSETYHRVLMQLKRAGKAVAPEPVVRAVRSLNLVPRLMEMNRDTEQVSLIRERLKDEEEWLYTKFESDVLELEDLLGRDLSMWRRS